VVAEQLGLRPMRCRKSEGQAACSVSHSARHGKRGNGIGVGLPTARDRTVVSQPKNVCGVVWCVGVVGKGKEGGKREETDEMDQRKGST
jgi:hypothetical protein